MFIRFLLPNVHRFEVELVCLAIAAHAHADAIVAAQVQVLALCALPAEAAALLRELLTHSLCFRI